jgi:hypothetical protein
MSRAGVVAVSRDGRGWALRVLGSDGEDEFGEGARDPMPRVDIKAEFVMAAVEVLDESMSCAELLGRNAAV